MSSMQLMRKAAGLPADLLFFDLEDAAPDHPEFKSFARQFAIEALTTTDFGSRIVGYRPNNIRTDYFERDIVDVVTAAGDRLDVIIIPKTEYAEEVADIVRIVRRIQQTRHRTNRISVEVLVESPRGLLEAPRIAALDGVTALIYGSFDFARTTGGVVDPVTWSTDHATARQQLPIIAAAFGKDAVDAVTATLPVRPERPPGIPEEEYRRALDTDPASLDPVRFTAEFRARLEERRRATELAADDAMSARRCGYAAKWILHPDQIAPIQKAWTPDRNEALAALDLVVRYTRSSAAGSGAEAHGSRMTDKATAAADWWIVLYALASGVLADADIAATGFHRDQLERSLLPQRRTP